jgi:hypothetical protein
MGSLSGSSWGVIDGALRSTDDTRRAYENAPIHFVARGFLLKQTRRRPRDFVGCVRV